MSLRWSWRRIPSHGEHPNPGNSLFFVDQASLSTNRGLMAALLCDRTEKRQAFFEGLVKPDSTLAVATSCHWVKKIISYSNFHQTFQIGSYFFRNTYGLVKKIFRAKKRTSIGLIFSHFRSIFLIFGLFFSPTENFVIFICFTINFLNCFVYCPSGHFKINV